MKRLLAMFAVTALPLCANAQALGNVAGCERVAGVEESTDNLFVLWPHRIESWETNCTITDVQGDFNVRVLISTECSGEGAEWDQIFAMTPVGTDAYSIGPVEFEEIVHEVRACG